MRVRNRILLLCLCSALICITYQSYAQPVYSPEVRSEREMLWMKDSLHISDGLYKKISAISLRYQRHMDKAGQPGNKASKDKAQQKLMQKKDTDLKVLLNKQQYLKYYRREKQIREIAKRVYPADRQPM
jgi:hypothetical protein